ncbi:hypothetical protein FRX31_017969 [Thalictrum thalictroides]|uniref:Pentatricopeptide repeat-containing protein n=1 Tax=Thalictrum thalictroides TaxID=46969 RepID=A0A7J6W502_THATH|nr:hypothetical protein FRX31_017969 [Thalictrum thalictroides]
MIKGYCNEGMLEDAHKLFLQMEETGCPPNEVTYKTLLRGYLQKKDVLKAKLIIDEMIEKKLLSEESPLPMSKLNITPTGGELECKLAGMRSGSTFLNPSGIWVNGNSSSFFRLNSSISVLMEEEDDPKQRPYNGPSRKLEEQVVIEVHTLTLASSQILYYKGHRKRVMDVYISEDYVRIRRMEKKDHIRRRSEINSDSGKVDVEKMISRSSSAFMSTNKQVLRSGGMSENPLFNLISA